MLKKTMKCLTGACTGLALALLAHMPALAAPLERWVVGPALSDGASPLCETIQEHLIEGLRSYPEMLVFERYYANQSASRLQLTPQLQPESPAGADWLRRYAAAFPAGRVFPLACSRQGQSLKLSLYQAGSDGKARLLKSLTGPESQVLELQSGLMEALAAQLPAALAGRKRWQPRLRPAPLQAWQLLNQAQASEDKAAALALTNQALSLAPDYLEALTLRANLQRLSQDPVAAIETLDLALKRQADYYPAVNIQALVYAGEEDFDRAIAVLQGVLKAYPHLPELRFNLAKIQDAAEQFGPAAESYGALLELTPQNLEALNLRGIAYRKSGQFEKALADHTRLIEAMPDQAYAYTARANDYLLMGQCERARPDYEQACKLRGQPCQLGCQIANAEHAAGHFQRGLALMKQGRYAEALQAYDQALVLTPQDANALINRGVVHYELGNFRQALADQSAALALRPDDEQALYNRGNAYAELGATELAFKDYERAIAVNPKSANSYYNRGVLYWEAGDIEKAQADFGKACELGLDQACQLK